MRFAALFLLCLTVTGGCVGSGPSDADQQKLAKDWSPDKVAEAYEKAGKHAEAEEVRRNASSQGQQ
jgi:hypothetical protein